MDSLTALYEQISSNVPQYLYHSTLKAFASSVRQHGIVPGGKECRLYDWCEAKYIYIYIYFASTSPLSQSFVSLGTLEVDDDKYEELESLFGDGGITYQIDTSKLDKPLLEFDPNWHGDEVCYAYAGVIPVDAIVDVTQFWPD